MSASCGVAVCSASRAGPTTPGHRNRRWLVSNASFSSQDPDQCPVRTRSQPSRRPACNRHRKEGEWPGRSLLRCCAHRFSGSGWLIVSVHCRSRYGGLMAAARLSCRATSYARTGIRQSRRRQFAGMSEGSLRIPRGRTGPQPSVKRPPSTVRKPHDLSSTPAN